MGVDRVPGQQLLLFHSSLTCVYFPAIFAMMKYNESVYNVGSFEFVPVLGLLTFAELLKFFYTLSHSKQIIIGKMDSRMNTRFKKFVSKIIKGSVKFVIFGALLFTSYFLAIVLFGAPFLKHNKETAMLALTLVTLTYIPAYLHLGIDATLAILTVNSTQNSNLLHEAICLNIKATLLGAWLGAIPIPLDWDRPWQTWPITCVLGALIGYSLGNFFTLVKTLLALRCCKKAQR